VEPQYPPSLKELIAAVRSGDEQAWQSLYETYNPRLHALASSYLRQHGSQVPDDWQEVVNSTWANIFKYIDQLHDPSHFFAWARTVLINEANKLLHRNINTQRREVHFDDLLKKDPDGAQRQELPFESEPLVDRVAVYEANRLADKVLTIAYDISPKFYRILLMQLTEDLDLREIARRTGESYGNTRTILSRGKRELKRRLSAEGIGGDDVVR
jgi:RNA polymerase sigma factor (sigma-70 family)